MLGGFAYLIWFIFLQKQNAATEVRERVLEAGGGALSAEASDEIVGVVGGMSMRGQQYAPGPLPLAGTPEPKAEAGPEGPDVLQLEQPALVVWPEIWFYATAMPDPNEKIAEDLKDLGKGRGVWVSKGFEIGRYSYYWPPLGGINCSGNCEITASGSPWAGYVGWGVACPGEIEFGTWVRWDGGEAMCIDRGGKIVRESDGGMWFDFLQESPDLRWGTLFRVELGVYEDFEFDW